jgi:hypothetical protein
MRQGGTKHGDRGPSRDRTSDTRIKSRGRLNAHGNGSERPHPWVPILNSLTAHNADGIIAYQTDDKRE